MIDETHDAARRSWVASANGHPDFPIQNLPLGIFSRGGGAGRCGVAIGDKIVDIPAAHHAGLLAGIGAETLSAATLNAFLALGAVPRRALRARLSELLSEEATPLAREKLAPALHDAAECAPHLPCAIGDYTDFFAGIHHAVNAGKNFRPDNPLLQNYKYVPIAYHGRASSIRPSGGAVRRPNGQRKPANETVPSFGPSRNLDYELELGVWIGTGNALGHPVPIAEAGAHIARCLPAQRLVGARHPRLGIPAARPVPGEEFLLDDLAVDRDRRGAGAIPTFATPHGRRAIPRRCRIFGTIRTSAMARSISDWRFFC